MADLQALTNYYDRLAQLPWHRLVLGDDWQATAEHDALRQIAWDCGGGFSDLYEAFSRYYSTGPAFGTERAPMPQRPSGQLTIV